MDVNGLLYDRVMIRGGRSHSGLALWAFRNVLMYVLMGRSVDNAPSAHRVLRSMGVNLVIRVKPSLFALAR